MLSRAHPLHHFQQEMRCPWCDRSARSWGFRLETDPLFWLECEHCGRVSIWTGEGLLWPLGANTPVPRSVVERALRACEHEVTGLLAQMRRLLASIERERQLRRGSTDPGARGAVEAMLEEVEAIERRVQEVIRFVELSTSALVNSGVNPEANPDR